MTDTLVTSAVAYTLPSRATATHRPALVQDTALSAPVVANGVACHVHMADGFVDTRTLPAPSTATHNRTVGHESAFSR